MRINNFRKIWTVWGVVGKNHEAVNFYFELTFYWDFLDQVRCVLFSNNTVESRMYEKLRFVIIFFALITIHGVKGGLVLSKQEDTGMLRPFIFQSSVFITTEIELKVLSKMTRSAIRSVGGTIEAAENVIGKLKRSCNCDKSFSSSGNYSIKIFSITIITILF